MTGFAELLRVLPNGRFIGFVNELRDFLSAVRSREKLFSQSREFDLAPQGIASALKLSNLGDDVCGFLRNSKIKMPGIAGHCFHRSRE